MSGIQAPVYLNNHTIKEVLSVQTSTITSNLQISV